MKKRLAAALLALVLTVSVAVAQFFPFPGPGRAGSGGGGGSASFTPIYADAQYINSASNTYTSPSQTWTSGTAIVFIVTRDAVKNDLAVTIKGTTATQVGTYGGTSQQGSLWTASVTAGSGTVQATSASNFIHIDTSGGVVTTTTPTPSASQINDMAVVLEPQGTVTATVPSSGVGIAFAGGGFVTAASLPMIWTGVANSTTLAAAVTGGNNSGIGGGSTTVSGSTTPTVATQNGSFNFAGGSATMAIVAFSP